MSDHKAICDATSVQDLGWNDFAERAETYWKDGQQPRIITSQELLGAIQFIRERPSEICETPDGRAKAALVLGYVTEAESIDTKIQPADVRQIVFKDYDTFRRLAESSTGGALSRAVSRLANDVLDVVSPFYCDHRGNDAAMPEQETVLRAILDQVSATSKKGGRPVVIFDLDDTLFDHAQKRDYRILQEYLDDFTTKNPGKLSQAEIDKILSIKPEEVGYKMDLELRTIWRIQNQDFIKGWKPFFLPRLLSPGYCEHDLPHPGAPEYVRALHEAGAIIVYLTGRHERGKMPGTEKGMREGTLTAFRRNNFPIPNNKSVYLFMKPNLEDNDFEFKNKSIARIKKLGTVVAAFDNEPAADKFYADQTDATVVDIGMCQTPFYGKVKTLQDIPFEPETVVRITDFRRARIPAGVLK